eukprot:5027112-Amphidinium_carterae.1
MRNTCSHRRGRADLQPSEGAIIRAQVLRWAWLLCAQTSARTISGLQFYDVLQRCSPFSSKV